ncbi:MAG: RNA polymerase subunit sigma-70 [Acidobacteria bacterium]|nr:MAG: RNA polymerase subunit sigma-70 [Acidobacteriota bacterium]
MTPSDDELLQQLRTGDENAFTTLYRRRQGGVYRFALQMSGSKTIAEDITQEVFLALMQDSRGYDPNRGSLAGYLFGIARNHVLRHLERDRLHDPIRDEPDGGEAGAAPPLVSPDDPLDDLTRHEKIKFVRQAVLALPAHYREVVVLCDLHEMSYAEVAAVIGCAVGTIRSRLHRAHGLLIDKLRDGTRPGSTSSKMNARCFA